MDERKANSEAWDWEAENGSCWAEMAEEREIKAAREGKPNVRITIEKSVPESWYRPLKGKKVLLLASAGGQQTAILAAFGATVTSLDISRKMIELDRKALEHYGLEGNCILGDMTDLSQFEKESFFAIVNPVSLNFVEDIKKVFAEEYRVLEKGGRLMFGIANPALYLFDDRLLEKGKMKIRYTLPFSDTKSLSKKELEKRLKHHDTVEFSHTLESIIGGVTEAGFSIKGFFSDSSSFEPIDSFLFDSYLAFLCVKD